MYIIDLDKKIAHNLSRPQYECHINKIDKKRRKKIFTDDGIKRFLDNNSLKGYNGCEFCMPDYHEFNMQKIFG
ncbi:MAG: hypothetical protein P9L92_03810 [Candidatus Electryonea clarkiae]|nr:hypothetical protein [Candidatus Electryonea clarkiae]MDP8286942.1 hypothetical protein [Candidatus Electryonea clarkiae]